MVQNLCFANLGLPLGQLKTLTEEKKILDDSLVLSLSNDGPHPTLETVNEFTERDASVHSGFIVDFKRATTVESIRKEEDAGQSTTQRQQRAFDYLRKLYQDHNQNQNHTPHAESVDQIVTALGCQSQSQAQISQILHDVYSYLDGTQKMQDFQQQACDYVSLQVQSFHLEERVQTLRVGGQVLEEKAQKVNQQFDESIDTMKKTKLHSDLIRSAAVKGDATTLMDIYYDEGKLKAWRDNLIKQAQSNARKVDRLSDNVAKIRNLPLQFLQREAGFQSYTDLKQNFDKLIQWHVAAQQETPEEDSQVIQNLTTVKETIEQAYLGNCILMGQLIIEFTIKIGPKSQSWAALGKEVSDLAAKQQKLTTDLQTLQKPSNFLSAYPKILSEINRRNLFNQCLQTDLEVINHVISSEIMERKKFLKQYCDEIPESFIPQLDLLPRKVMFQHEDERKLPHIDVGLQLETVPYLLQYLVDREIKSIQYDDSSLSTQIDPPISARIHTEEDLARSEFNLDTTPRREDKSTLSPRLLSETKIPSLDTQLQKNISFALHKSKLKMLKKQIKACNRTNESQLKQIKELSDLYSLSLQRNQLADEPNAILAHSKLLRQVCESNYLLVQQVTQVKKHALRERLKVLEDENSQLKQKIESENSMLISKEEHKAFVTKLHEMHTQECQKIKSECEALYQTIDELVTSSESIKEELRSMQSVVEGEKQQRVKIHNELEYKKLENQKLVAERVELKLEMEKKVRELQEKLDTQKAVYKEQKAKLENQISLKDIQVEQIVTKVNELGEIKKTLEQKHAEQLSDYKAKLVAKDSQLKNQIQVHERSEAALKKLVKDHEQSQKQALQAETELGQLQERYAQLKKASQQLQYQIDNLKISKEQQTLSHQEKQKEIRDLEQELERLKKIVSEKDSALQKYITQNDQLQISLELANKETNTELQQQLVQLKTHFEEAKSTLEKRLREQQKQSKQELAGVITEKNQLQKMNEELMSAQSPRKQECLDCVSLTQISPGTRMIFMPDQPGIYVALQLNDPGVVDDAQSMASFTSNTSKASQQPALKKIQLQANTFLDLAKLPKKTSSILKNFEMIVVGKIVSTYEEGSLQDDEEELEFDENLQVVKGKNREQQEGVKTYCEVQVEQLVAFSDLQFTIYSHIY